MDKILHFSIFCILSFQCYYQYFAMSPLLLYLCKEFEYFLQFRICKLFPTLFTSSDSHYFQILGPILTHSHTFFDFKFSLTISVPTFNEISILRTSNALSRCTVYYQWISTLFQLCLHELLCFLCTIDCVAHFTRFELELKFFLWF